MNAEQQLDRIFNAALADGNTDVDVLWTMSLTMLADVLLRSDEFTRERLLKELVPGGLTVTHRSGLPFRP
jgi:hypothetical protein